MCIRDRAYFCGDDVLSIGVLSALEDSDIRVPEDVGVIGLNDMEMSGWESINLTTIKQPIEQIISSSIELVVAMIDDPERYPEARLFPTVVVERGTLRDVAMRDVAMRDVAMRDVAMRDEAMRDEAMRDEAMRDEPKRDKH